MNACTLLDLVGADDAEHARPATDLEHVFGCGTPRGVPLLWASDEKAELPSSSDDESSSVLLIGMAPCRSLCELRQNMMKEVEAKKNTRQRNRMEPVSPPSTPSPVSTVAWPNAKDPS